MADHAPTTDAHARADLIAQLDRSGIPQVVNHTRQLDEVVSEFSGNPQAMASAILQLRASLALARSTGQWFPIEGAPAGTWLRTRREGEAGESITWFRWVDGEREWIGRDGRTTVTHGTFLPPTHYHLGAASMVTRAMCEKAVEWAQLNGAAMTLEQASAILCAALSAEHAHDAPHPCAHTMGSCAGCYGEGVCGLPPIPADGGPEA